MHILRYLGMATAIILFGCECFVRAADTPQSVHAFQVQTITGEDIALDTYRGNVLLIVNVASRCGLTGQYKGLQALYEKYREQGFQVLGFPSNDFGRQEPGTNAEILQFCTSEYSVTFPMFAKISVKGPEQHPLYTYLTATHATHGHGGDIGWNFTKFLVDREGRVINRFASRTRPQDGAIIKAIEDALGITTP